MLYNAESLALSLHPIHKHPSKDKITQGAIKLSRQPRLLPGCEVVVFGNKAPWKSVPGIPQTPLPFLHSPNWANACLKALNTAMSSHLSSKIEDVLFMCVTPQTIVWTRTQNHYPHSIPTLPSHTALDCGSNKPVPLTFSYSR